MNVAKMAGLPPLVVNLAKAKSIEFAKKMEKMMHLFNFEGRFDTLREPESGAFQQSFPG